MTKKEDLIKQLATGFKEIFNKYPILDEFSWLQYTPYFNDGSPCEFERLGNLAYVNGTQGYAIECPDTPEEIEQAKQLQPIQNDIVALLERYNTNDYKKMFGDHAQVIVSKGQIRVEFYDHE